MAAVDRSLLPCDLVRRVADCFLATNDVDFYMDFRAVCGNWRRATDDPKENPTDPHFRPDRRWIIIDDSPRCCVLVNAITGRFLRKDLPPLGSHNFVEDAPPTCGFLILAQRERGTDLHRAITIVNPFTGYAVRFRAPSPPTMFFDVLSVSGSSPTLMLYDEHYNLCVAGPDDERFTLYVPEEDRHYHYLIRLAALSGIYTGDLRAAPLPEAFASKIPGSLDFDDISPPKQRYHAFGSRFYLIECDGEVLLVYKSYVGRLELFKMDTARDVLQRVKSIGNHAIFLGNISSVAVNADKFPYIKANSIYFRYYHQVYRYDLKNGNSEVIREDYERQMDPRPLSLQFFYILRHYRPKGRMQRRRR